MRSWHHLPVIIRIRLIIRSVSIAALLHGKDFVRAIGGKLIICFALISLCAGAYLFFLFPKEKRTGGYVIGYWKVCAVRQ